MIDVDVRASGVNIRRGGRIVLEFAIENADRKMALPTVVYSSAIRTRLEKRRELLSDEYAPEPFYTYDKVKRRDSYNLHYRLSVPYQGWMAGAMLMVREYRQSCSKGWLASTARLIEQFGTPPERVVYVVREVQTRAPQVKAVERAEIEVPEGCESCKEQAQGVWRYRRNNRRGQ